MSKPLSIQTPSKIKKMMDDIEDKDSALHKSLSDKRKILLTDKVVTK